VRLGLRRTLNGKRERLGMIQGVWVKDREKRVI